MWSICPCAHILGLNVRPRGFLPCLPLNMPFIYLVYMWRKRGSCYFWDIYATKRDGFTARQYKPSAEVQICWSWVNGNILFSFSHTQINNKACGTVTIPLQASKDLELVRQLVLESPLGQKRLAGCFIKRAILSPRTALINFLIDEWCLCGLCHCWLSLAGVFWWEWLNVITWVYIFQDIFLI